MKLIVFLSLLLYQVSISAEEGLYSKKYYLKPRVVVHSGEVRASDLLNWKSAWNPVLYSNLTSPLILLPDEVTAKFKEMGSANDEITSQIEINGTTSNVVPLTSEWSKKKIENSLIEFLKVEIGVENENYILNYAGEPIFLPENNVVFNWRKFGKNIHGGKRIFPLDVFFENKLIHSVPLSFIIEEKKEAWFAKHLIEAKQVIGEADVEKKSFFTSDNHIEYDLINPVGKTALNAITEGAAIQKKQTRLLHLVERGGEVSLVFTAGNIMIKIKTRALASGNEGDKIELLNLSSNKKLLGKIQSAGVCLLEDLR